MFYKICFFDLDGTLLDIGRGRKAWISKKNSDAVRKLANKCIIVISTGRKFNSKVALIGRQIKAKFYICQNGAEIFDKNFSTLFKTGIKQEIISKIIEITKRFNFVISFNSKVFFFKNLFIKFLNFFLKSFDFKPFRQILVPENVRKILIFSVNIWKIKKFAYILEKIFSDNLQICLIRKFRVIEITDISASKGKAVEFITKFSNISLDYALHIGDSENDISTKKIVKMLIIMQSGAKSAKKNADFIGYKRKFGIAKVINNFILEPKSAAIVGKYGSGKTTFLKKVEKFGYSVLYTDEFFHNCYLASGECFKIIKKIRPDFINENIVNKNKIRNFMLKSKQNRDLIEKSIYPFLENHLSKNHYHFVEIPNLWTKNANFGKFFSKVVWIYTSKKQQLLNIKRKKVKNDIKLKNQALNTGKIQFYDVKISNRKWKKPGFFLKFFSKIFE
ncbi:HAD-IIB family hydrolase [Mesomycoplasma hyopneumoniae]|uniref:HAD-IIB family hydrolase n=1 Tax=Mesomycoplasma hyopneumoniae TaxID=2099 RepID=UPI0032AEDE19